jgi:hypothetical protein
MEPAIKIALVGLDKYSRELSPVKFDIVAVATRSQKSVEKPAAAFAEWTHPIATIEGQRPDSIPALGNAQGRLPPTSPDGERAESSAQNCEQMRQQMDRAFSPRSVFASNPGPTLEPA